MGQANDRAKAEEKVFHRILVGWVQRAIVIHTLNKASAKGDHAHKAMARALKAFMKDDDFDYLEEGGNPLHEPGREVYSLPSIPERAAKVLRDSGIPVPEGDTKKTSVKIFVSDEKKPPRVLDLTDAVVDFVLKEVWEDATLSGIASLKISGLLEDLKAAKKDEYELPEEYREKPQLKALPEIENEAERGN